MAIENNDTYKTLYEMASNLMTVKKPKIEVEVDEKYICEEGPNAKYIGIGMHLALRALAENN